MKTKKTFMHHIVLAGFTLLISLIGTSASAVTFGYTGSGTFTNPDPDPSTDPAIVVSGIGSSAISYGTGGSTLSFTGQQDVLGVGGVTSVPNALLGAGDILRLGEFNFSNASNGNGTVIEGITLDMGLSQCDLDLLALGAGFECGGVSNNNPLPFKPDGVTPTEPNFSGQLEISLFNTANSADPVASADAFCFTLAGAATTTQVDPDGAGPLGPVTAELFGTCGWAQEGASLAAFALDVQLGSIFGYKLTALTKEAFTTQIIRLEGGTLVFDPTFNPSFGVPAPSTIALFGLGLLGFSLRKRKA